MCEIAARVTRETGLGFSIVGFDAGTGLPKPFDDVHFMEHNEFQGALLALNEFNHLRTDRKIAPVNWLDHYRLFHWAAWIRRMYFLHMFGHPYRARGLSIRGTSVLSNPYLS
jgi:hypothetical protein